MKQELKFKTNINCGGCVKAVTSYLTEAKGILKWEVDTDNDKKVLTVLSDGITQEQIVDIVKKAGFSIEPLME